MSKTEGHPVSDEADGRFIIFRCECGQKIKVPAEHTGAKGQCKSCGRRLVVPTPERPDRREEERPQPEYIVSPHHIRELEGDYSEDDLVTYPERPPIRKAPDVSSRQRELEKSLIGELKDILRYPFKNKLAMQIFFSGAFFFSPLVWLVIVALNYVPCCLKYFVIGPYFIGVLGIRLMYFSYLLLIIQKSAEGSKQIPELPVFQSWQENLRDLLKVLGVSALAFSPFLVYACAVNFQVLMHVLEAYNRGATPGTDALSGTSYSLAALILVYAIAAFYMPMVLMALVVNKSFAKAVNPAFIFRSISRIAREYLMAMLIIFVFLRGALTLFTVLKDVFFADWFSMLSKYIFEPTIKFYVFVVTMHVIGLLYYRNGEKLKW